MSQSALRIKNRIRTSKNIAQITKAMGMVSASKMRRAQAKAIAGMGFSQELANMLYRLTVRIDPTTNPLLKINPEGRPAYLLISTDKGLAGSLNTNLFNYTLHTISKTQQPIFLTIGRKARDFVIKSKYELLTSFTDIPAKPTSQDVAPIAQIVAQNYTNGSWSEFNVLYPKFISTLAQKPLLLNLLPFGTPEDPTADVKDLATNLKTDYRFEPSPQAVLEWLLPYYIQNRIYQILLEFQASEHSARMIAMKNANDAAKDIVENLSLVYNQARQAKITSELLDAYAARLTVN